MVFPRLAAIGRHAVRRSAGATARARPVTELPVPLPVRAIVVTTLMLGGILTPRGPREAGQFGIARLGRKAGHDSFQRRIGRQTAAYQRPEYREGYRQRAP